MPDTIKDHPKAICIGCNKTPDQLVEYQPACTGETGALADPEAYVRSQEGTYNRKNGHFLCTDCYIKAGQPSSPRGWVAP